MVFSTRIRPDLRASLEAAKNRSGRSLSQEVEHRLRRSFIEDEKIADLFGSRENYFIMRIVALAMQYARIPFRGGKHRDWLRDPLNFEVVVRTVNNVLDSIRPAGSVDYQDPSRTAALAEFVTKQIPAAIWDQIQKADPALPLDKGTRDQHRAGLLKSELGDIAARAKPKILDADDLADIANKHGAWHNRKKRIRKKK
jgi:TraY domain-containing protein